jgi:arylsulfatase A-like enzyme
MFTGLYPSWHRAIVEPEHPYGGSLRPGAKTMAGMLRASGYWTAEAVANYGYLGETSGLTQGFERVDARVAVHLADTNRPFYLREGARRLLNSFLDTDRFDEYRLRASDINRHAFDILDRAESRRQPFFLFLNYMDAHVPYIPGEPFGERFSEEEAHVKPIPAREYLPVRDAVNAGKRVLADAEKRYLISQYDAGIANIDAAIGDLLARLRERGLYDNTLIIVTSDHGEAFGDHDYMEHAVGSLYQDQVHVPLFVKYPGRHEASQSDALVSQVDFLPTVLETAGIAVPSGLQGESFRSRGRDAVIFAETSTRGSLRSMPRFRGMRRAIFSGGLKLILWTDGAPEFYEVAGDEAELKNEFRPDDPRIAQLTARAITWIAAMPRPAAGSRNPKPVDPATLQRLRSLGYAK